MRLSGCSGRGRTKEEETTTTTVCVDVNCRLLLSCNGLHVIYIKRTTTCPQVKSIVTAALSIQHFSDYHNRPFYHLYR